MKNPLVFFASSAKDGHTYAAIGKVFDGKDHEIIDLTEYKINIFDYNGEYEADDQFAHLASLMVNANEVILATPIYWYTMSAQMKIFVDRWTDLLKFDKDSGRKMRGKKLFIITSYGIHPEGKDGFEQIFINIAEYMGMEYGGCYFNFSGDDISVSSTNCYRAFELYNKINGKL